MLVVDDPAAFTPPAGGSAVTVGAYDGVHIGHQRLIERLRAVAAARGLKTAVVTFDRHPAFVVRPESAPKLLTDLETKLELLAGIGVDYTVVVRFDAARAHEPAEDFVRTVLVGALDARVVAVGRDFHFGHNREGNVAFLERLGPVLGFEVIPVDLIDEGGGGSHDKVSSTRVRRALGEGDVVAAASLLGRPHGVRGRVVAVDGEGGQSARGAGARRARLAVPAEICLPAEGLYAGWFCSGAARAPAALRVGAGHLVDAYLVDQPGPVEDGPAEAEFCAPLAAQSGDAVLAALQQSGL